MCSLQKSSKGQNEQCASNNERIKHLLFNVLLRKIKDQFSLDNSCIVDEHGWLPDLR